MVIALQVCSRRPDTTVRANKGSEDGLFAGSSSWSMGSAAEAILSSTVEGYI